MTESTAPAQNPPSSDGRGKPPARPPEPVTLQDIIDVVQTSVAKAKEGDAWHAEIVRRYWRDRRATIVLDIGATRTAAEIAEAQGKVLVLTFAGEITPREGRDVSTMLEHRRRALHTLEQQHQLDELVEFANEQKASANRKDPR